VRMPGVRFTVRRAMLVVAGMALITWLTIPAIHILNDPGRRTLTHLWQRPDGSYLFSSHPVGFWARYRWRLLDLPWDCPFEMCEHNKKLFHEVDSGRSVDSMLRDHPIVVKMASPPR
jgi:hypothetical protein